MSDSCSFDSVRASAPAAEDCPAASHFRKPIFVGSKHPVDASRVGLGFGILAADTYMTALEMQSTVALLTGFLHPDFETFASSLGAIDNQTGRRTTDRPSLVAVLFFRRVSADIAAAVIERETFVDDSERIVFGGIDLKRSPADSELQELVARIYGTWLGVGIGQENLVLLTGLFRQRERTANTVAAYQAFVEVLLQHGGIYFTS